LYRQEAVKISVAAMEALRIKGYLSSVLDETQSFWCLSFPVLMENSIMLVMSNYNHQADDTKKWFYVL
jgi:hypothetical protein